MLNEMYLFESGHVILLLNTRKIALPWVSPEINPKAMFR